MREVLWVARSLNGCRGFKRKPLRWKAYGQPNDFRWYGGFDRGRVLNAADFPDLKPGECRRVTLTLEAPNAHP